MIAITQPSTSLPTPSSQTRIWIFLLMHPTILTSTSHGPLDLQLARYQGKRSRWWPGLTLKNIGTVSHVRSLISGVIPTSLSMSMLATSPGQSKSRLPSPNTTPSWTWSSFLSPSSAVSCRSCWWPRWFGRLNRHAGPHGGESNSCESVSRWRVVLLPRWM